MRRPRALHATKLRYRRGVPIRSHPAGRDSTGPATRGPAATGSTAHGVPNAPSPHALTAQRAHTLGRRARGGTLVAAAAAAALVAGCGAGFDAGTTVQKTVSAGAYGAADGIAAQNVVLVRGEGETASLVATFVNSSPVDDVLTAVIVDNPRPSAITSTTGGAIPIPARTTTKVGFDGGEQVLLEGFNPPASAFVSVLLSFEIAGDIPLDVLVVPPTGSFAGLGPTP